MDDGRWNQTWTRTQTQTQTTLSLDDEPSGQICGQVSSRGGNERGGVSSGFIRGPHQSWSCLKFTFISKIKKVPGW